jgi:hypothetical protein
LLENGHSPDSGPGRIPVPADVDPYDSPRIPGVPFEFAASQPLEQQTEVAKVLIAGVTLGIPRCVVMPSVDKDHDKGATRSIPVARTRPLNQIYREFQLLWVNRTRFVIESHHAHVKCHRLIIANRQFEH